MPTARRSRVCCEVKRYTVPDFCISPTITAGLVPICTMRSMAGTVSSLGPPAETGVARRGPLEQPIASARRLPAITPAAAVRARARTRRAGMAASVMGSGVWLTTMPRHHRQARWGEWPASAPLEQNPEEGPQRVVLPVAHHRGRLDGERPVVPQQPLPESVQTQLTAHRARLASP